MGSSLYALESGSDFKSRGKSVDSRVIFRPGVTMSTCDIMLIDDSEYEEEEEFEIALAGASDNARIGRVSSAKVLISGPNDASTVSLGNTAFTVSEDAGNEEHLKGPITHLLIPFLNDFLLGLRMSWRHWECHSSLTPLLVESLYDARHCNQEWKGIKNREFHSLFLLWLLMAGRDLAFSFIDWPLWSRGKAWC